MLHHDFDCILLELVFCDTASVFILLTFVQYMWKYYNCSHCFILQFVFNQFCVCVLLFSMGAIPVAFLLLPERGLNCES